MNIIDKSKYKCMECKFEFEREFPGMVTCPKCNNNYVEWVNHEKVLKQIRKKHPELFKGENKK